MYRSSNFKKSYKGGNRFYGKRGRSIKKLDSRLFIKNTVENQTVEKVVSIPFSSFNISDKLKRNIQDKGYTETTPIQTEAIPHILAGRDLIGISNTGTGKTAAFLVPTVNKAFGDRSQRTLIVTPTRELAGQIMDELKIFTLGMDLEAVLCIGGASMGRQIERLKHGPHFVIGTPGRLKDLIERRKLNLLQFQTIILDEVDRMVDVGFINDVKYLVSLLPKQRQSLFFSATVPPKVAEILRAFVTNAVTVSVKSGETAENVQQNIIRVPYKSQKVDILHDLLIKEGFNKVLIFGRTKWGIEKLKHALTDRGFKTVSIHGNKNQNQRQKALEQFKNNEVKILLATDVASRGIDIDDVTHVINYDAPESYNDYVHRIGRTGRADKKGIALTFVE